MVNVYRGTHCKTCFRGVWSGRVRNHNTTSIMKVIENSLVHAVYNDNISQSLLVCKNELVDSFLLSLVF
jgi:hypothetical protein